MNKITYFMPDNEEAQMFITCLSQMLHFGEIEGYTPATFFVLKENITQPNIVFDGSDIEPLVVDSVRLCSDEQSIDTVKDTIHYIPTVGTYLEMEEFVKRLKNAAVRLDHTGINLPAKALKKNVWENFILQLGRKAVVFDYPGEPWPFIIPATRAELAGAITDTWVARGPKFEMVYDRYTSIPLIQFAVGTNLSQQEVHKLFPGPYAESFPNLAHLFRAVYVRSPWNGLAIRFDIGYASGTTEDRLLKYLITEGKRVT